MTGIVARLAQLVEHETVNLTGRGFKSHVGRFFFLIFFLQSKGVRGKMQYAKKHVNTETK